MSLQTRKIFIIFRTHTQKYIFDEIREKGSKEIVKIVHVISVV